ncbi:unnamed protein product [Brachionus calyciflorus]|uniref:Uncharacterized protein n=1 Tax=Brachionus calyciflorus TaxID=104777 RepID=A0A813NXP6_9BILA|nr:unnamed protein product [Brachionus calyciflorus]
MEYLSMQKNPNVLCFGSEEQCSILFNKISNYKNPSNKFKIDKLDNFFYNLQIDTKYYDLNLQIEVVPIEQVSTRVDSVLSNEFLLNQIQSIFVLIDAKNSNITQKIENLSKKLDELNEDNSCLNILIANDEFRNEEVEKFLENNENFVKIKLNNDENLSDDVEKEPFSDFDELINCILVHSWEGMVLKTDKKASKNTKKINKSNNQVSNDEDLDEPDSDLDNLMMNLKEIREQSLKLDFNERKKYAENVTLNFWKSIGGDPDEIKDLSEEN